jgi:type II secretory ATPase GspE/PulE/Tfp pilus assembly ATPase PilB-like protein
MIGELDVLKEGIPQQNELISKLDDKELPIRVSTTPTIFGEAVLMEIIPETTSIIGLDRLGFEPRVISQLKSIVQKPSGMIIITGPAGSGKSTTAYSLLLEIDANKKKITTIEKTFLFPYRNPNFIQITLNPKIGLDNYNALTCALNQHSDVVMISELEQNIISSAINASLSGKLLIAQMNYKTCFDVLYHLMSMDIPKVAIATSLIGIIAQRLIGENIIAEVLIITEEIRELIKQAQPVEKIQQLAIKQGFKGVDNEENPRKL